MVARSFSVQVITFAFVKVNKAEPTLALKPRGDVTRNPKQDTSGPIIGHVNVSDKNMFKKFKRKTSHMTSATSKMYQRSSILVKFVM